MTDKPKTATELVNAIMGAPVEPPASSAPPVSALAVPADLDAAAEELVELYFVLEEPTERDVVFEQLILIESPVVTAFLSAMLVNDEDEFMRAAAAAELARRGDGAGTSALDDELRQPTDTQLFAQAVRVLVELRGAAMFETLSTIWKDPSYDSAERIEAMLGMEEADPPAALDAFVAFIDSLTDVADLPDDQVEAAMTAFARCAHGAARPALEALQQRIMTSPARDSDEQQELVGLIQEGLELLDTD